MSNTLVPGPGSYEFDNKTMSTSLSIKFGKGTRPSLENRDSINLPGPLEHSPNYRVTKNSSP